MEVYFDKLMMNKTEIQNLNSSNIEIYIETANDWIQDYTYFDLNLLNFTWEVWKYENQTKEDYNRSSNILTSDDNETILWINFTFNSPSNISPTKVQDKIVMNILPNDLFLSVSGEELENRILKKKIMR